MDISNQQVSISFDDQNDNAKIREITNNKPSVRFDELLEEAKHLQKNSKSKNTILSYAFDLRVFYRWLNQTGLVSKVPHSPKILASYLVFMHREEKKPTTIRRFLSAMSWENKINDYTGSENTVYSKLVKETLHGILRNRLSQGLSIQVSKKEPVKTDVILKFIRSFDLSTNRGLRDRAMLLVCFAGALKHAELVSLTAEDITFNEQGVDLLIRQSFNSQFEEQTVSIARASRHEICPVNALEEWMHTACICDGPIFMRIYKGDLISYGRPIYQRKVSIIIKDCCKKFGLDPTKYASHSLRSGFLMAATDNGSQLIPVVNHARYKVVDSALRYIKDNDRYNNNPTNGLL